MLKQNSDSVRDQRRKHFRETGISTDTTRKDSLE